MKILLIFGHPICLTFNASIHTVCMDIFNNCLILFMHIASVSLMHNPRTMNIQYVFVTMYTQCTTYMYAQEFIQYIEINSYPFIHSLNEHLQTSYLISKFQKSEK